MEFRRLGELTRAERRALVERRGPLEEILPRVRGIVDGVRRGGDRALLHYTMAFDGVRPRRVRVPRARSMAAWRALPARLQGALRRAARNIEAYHGEQRPRGYEIPLEGDPRLGSLGLRYLPFRRVGAYVPGGPRGYPSSLLMACIPARLAGVREVAVASPPGRSGWPADQVLAAAHLADVDEVYACGGAQAIAALAFGTETIAAVEKVVGPGNRYVTAAKMLLRDEVAIDGLLGPSEVLVVADDAADPAAVAWDLLSQAEHGPDARPLLVTPSRPLAAAVAGILGAEGTLVGGLDPYAAILLAGDLAEALAFADEFAPEHLVLNVRDPRAALEAIRGAGCVFLGPWTPVTLGDYCLGSNHSLPTLGQARWRGPLGVADFLKPMAYAEATAPGLRALAPTATALAEAEGFPAHARAVGVRLGGSP